MNNLNPIDIILRGIFALLALFFLSALVTVCIVVIKAAIDDRREQKNAGSVSRKSRK